ncbi:MAG: hypothetical protein ACP5QO_04470 [Clostridia bacterium]
MALTAGLRAQGWVVTPDGDVSLVEMGIDLEAPAGPPGRWAASASTGVSDVRIWPDRWDPPGHPHVGSGGADPNPGLAGGRAHPGRR